MAKNKLEKWYAIRRGRENNLVVDTYAECWEIVGNYEGAIFKKFDNFEDAQIFAAGGARIVTEQGDLVRAIMELNENVRLLTQAIQNGIQIKE
jgi:viroplasmin and RNaseH domain-containing protein